MNRRFIVILVVALACAAAAVSMYIVRLNVTALRQHAGELGVGVSFSGLRPAARGVVFTDAILHRPGSFDLYLVAPALRAGQHDDAWSIAMAGALMHLFGPWYSLPSGLVHRTEFRFGEGRVLFDGEVDTPSFVIDTPRIHGRPLVWKDLLFTFSGRVDKATSTLTLDRGSVRKDDASVDMSGSWRLGFAARPVNLVFQSRDLSGDQVRRLLPRILTTRLGDVRFGGRLGVSLRMYAAEMPTTPVRVALDIDNKLSVTGLAAPFALEPLVSNFSWQVYDTAGGSIRHDSGPASPGWCPLDAIPPAFTNAAVALVDPLFPIHRGISPHAMAQNLERELNGYGNTNTAETITERLAATLWPLPGTGLRRRVELAILATHLEQSLDKPTLLALYLNTADFGHGIRGIGEAARHLCHKAPRDLTACECVLLALSLADPSRPVVDLAGHALPAVVPAARAQLESLLQRSIITDEQFQAALAELGPDPTATQ
ncbi:MAG: biosynthetic peptidoglycan transglycosylase [bacterium]